MIRIFDLADPAEMRSEVKSAAGCEALERATPSPFVADEANRIVGEIGERHGMRVKSVR
jgi:hypothetical protein